MDFKTVSYDTDAYENGMWVDGIPGFGDMRLKVRGQLSDHSMALRTRLVRTASKAMREANGDLTEEALMAINVELLVLSNLVGWENISEGDVPIEYSPDAARKLVANKRFKLAALSYALAKVEAIMPDEAAIKN